LGDGRGELCCLAGGEGRLTDAAVDALGRVSTSDETFAAMGETLMWLIALEDVVVSVDGQYWTKRSADIDGAALPGIRYARNAVVHGEAVTATVELAGGAMLGVAQLGAFAFGEDPSNRCRDRASIGFTPKPKPWVPQQEECYDAEIDGRDVLPPLQSALMFLRNAAGA
jgi:hypothetical protein